MHRRDALAVIAASAGWTSVRAKNYAQSCDRPVYLTFDTGHMGIAPFVAQVLQRQRIQVTFFAAHERTQQGDGCLGEYWAPWWRERAREGHAFGSHTWQHAVWRADLPAGPDGPRFRIQPTAGPDAGRRETWTAAQYCADIRRAAERLAALTGQPALPLYRAPGGRTSPALLAAAERGGWRYVGWSSAGFLGDELPSERYPNEALLQRALATIGAGDILLAHLGIWSRHDPWAPAVLEPLIEGLKSRGLCFRTLREHPGYAAWIARHGGAPSAS